MATKSTQRPHAFNKKTEAAMELVLQSLRRGDLPAIAAEAGGITRSTFFQWKREDLEFAKRAEDAAEAGIDLLEQEAIRRARDGVDKPVFQGGERVGVIREYSDSLMGLVLRGRRRDVFNTERHEVTGKDGEPIEHNVNITFRSAK